MQFAAQKSANKPILCCSVPSDRVRFFRHTHTHTYRFRTGVACDGVFVFVGVCKCAFAAAGWKSNCGHFLPRAGTDNGSGDARDGGRVRGDGSN